MLRGDKVSEAPAGWPSRRGVGATPKLVTISDALLAATDARGAPDPDREPERWGAEALTWEEFLLDGLPAHTSRPIQVGVRIRLP